MGRGDSEVYQLEILWSHGEEHFVIVLYHEPNSGAYQALVWELEVVLPSDQGC